MGPMEKERIVTLEKRPSDRFRKEGGTSDDVHSNGILSRGELGKAMDVDPEKEARCGTYFATAEREAVRREKKRVYERSSRFVARAIPRIFTTNHAYPARCVSYGRHSSLRQIQSGSWYAKSGAVSAFHTKSTNRGN